MTVGRFGGKGDNERLMTPKEMALVRKVFSTAHLPPFSQIRIADGVNGNGGAWTDSDFQINVGPWLYDNDVAQYEPETLVHEMTHVWQYYNGQLTKSHAFFAQAGVGLIDGLTNFFSKKPAQEYGSLQDHLYKYDLAGSWDKMGFEGQAQLVEDWYQMGMKTEGYRYVFIKQIIYLGDLRMTSKTRAEIVVANPDIHTDSDLSSSERSVSFEQRPPLTDALLLGLLQQRFAKQDVGGYGERARRVEAIFSGTLVVEAAALYLRLASRQPADKVSVAFYDILSTAERMKLLGILRGRMKA